MNKFILPLLFLGFSFVANAQEVQEKQGSLITKVTATWCPNCGTWGWGFFKDVVADNQENAISWGVHYSGDLINPTASAIANNLSFQGQPVFFIGASNQGVNSGNTTDKRTQIATAVTENALLAPVANVGVNAEKVDGEINVQAKVKFFQEADGEYYLAMYAVEDDLVFQQSPIGMGAIHPKILRASFTDDKFGNLLSSGAISADAEFDQTFSLSLGASWVVENVEVAAVIWKKEGDNYTFVNGINVTEFAELVATNELTADIAEVKVMPTISSDQINVQLNLKTSSQNAEISVFDVNGKKVKAVFEGQLNQGTHSFYLNKNEGFSKGIYFVNLSIDGKIETRKVIFE